MRPTIDTRFTPGEPSRECQEHITPIAIERGQLLLGQLALDHQRGTSLGRHQTERFGLQRPRVRQEQIIAKIDGSFRCIDLNDEVTRQAAKNIATTTQGVMQLFKDYGS